MLDLYIKNYRKNFAQNAHDVYCFSNEAVGDYNNITTIRIVMNKEKLSKRTRENINKYFNYVCLFNVYKIRDDDSKPILVGTYEIIEDSIIIDENYFSSRFKRIIHED